MYLYKLYRQNNNIKLVSGIDTEYVHMLYYNISVSSFTATCSCLGLVLTLGSNVYTIKNMTFDLFYEVLEISNQPTIRTILI